MSGNSARIAAMPSSVHCASLRSSSLPVAMVKVSGSISRSDCGRPCWLQAKSTSRRAISQLVLGRLRHADLVDGQRDHRGAELLRQLQAVGARLLAILEVDRVDDRLAAMQLQRRLDHRRFGAVDHQRRIHRRGEAADHLGHLGDLVAADERGADVERVGAFADLLAAHGDAAVPVVLSPAARATSSSRWRCSARRWRRRRSPAAAAPPGTGWRPTGIQTGLRGTGAGRKPPRLRSIASSAAMCCDRWCRSSRRSG